MARFNEILVGRYNRFLQKLLGMKGQSPAPSIASEIFAHLPLFSGIENRYLEGWNRFALGAAQGPLAAQNTGFQLRNPAGSNVIGVIEGLSVDEAANDTILGNYGSDLVALATPFTSGSLDSRGAAPGTGGSTLACSMGNNVSVNGIQIFRKSLVGGTELNLILHPDMEIALPPGNVLRLITAAVNVTFAVNIQWRERLLEESERT